MTISSTTRTAGPFTGTGTASIFPFSFKVFQTSDVLVASVAIATGVQTTLTMGPGYTVALNASQDSSPGGTVTLPAVLATGYRLVVTSQVSNLQLTELLNQGGFYPDVLTTSLDRATILTQQLQEQTNNALQFPLTDPPINNVLPSAEERAGLFLAFDVNGVPYTTAGVPGPSNVLAVGVVGTGTAAATITGTSPNQTLNLTLPANSLAIGTVTQGTAAATITGSAPAQTLSLTLPPGPQGAASTVPGPTGPIGITGPQGAASTVPGPTGPTGLTGLTVQTWMGVYSGAITYAANAGVSYSGVNYVSNAAGNLNNTPSGASTYWTALPSPVLSTTAPVIAGTAAVGVLTTAAKGDHVHPSEVAGLAIAPTSVSTGGVALESAVAVLNPQSGVRYWCDSAGNVYMYCDATGVMHFPIGVRLDSVALNQPLSLPSITVNDAASTARTSVWLDCSMATTDSVGGVSSTIMPDGSLFVPQGVKGKFLANSSMDADGCVYYSQLDGPAGLIQLFKADPLGGVVWQLTSVGNNYAPQVSADGTKLTFISDSTGTEQVYISDLWAAVKVLANQDLRSLYQYNHLTVTGQSLAIGYSSTAISTTQPYSNLSFNSGPRCLINSGVTVPSGNIASLVPLIESTQTDSPNTDGETICSGMANRITQDMLPAGILFTSIASVSGEGAQPYSVIRKGAANYIYLNTLAEVTAAMALAVAAGKTYGVRAICLIHGEADQIAGTLGYDQLVTQLQKNYNTDIKAITGQTTDIPLLFCQISEWTSAGGGNVSVATIPFAQLAAHEASPGKCILVGPKYHLPYGATPHLTNSGYQRHGEYYGKVMERVLGQGKSWRPLSPRKIQRSGAQILVTFWVPVQPLVLDTTNVTPPTYNSLGLNGFEYYDNSGSIPAISSVAVVSPTSVLITLASVPSGTGNRLRYAYTCPLNTYANGTAGAAGPRGCLRDSDVSTSVYGWQMYNWCVHFDKAC